MAGLDVAGRDVDGIPDYDGDDDDFDVDDSDFCDDCRTYHRGECW